MAELLKNYEKQIEWITLIPSDGGRFEVTVNGNLIYSKLAAFRHPNRGEVVGLIQTYIEESI